MFTQTPERRRGSILIAVLAVVAIVSFVVIAFVEEAASKVKYYGLFYNRDDLRTEAHSMLDTTLAVLAEIQEIDGGIYSTAQGLRDQEIKRYARLVGDEFEDAELMISEDVTFDVKIIDESSRFPLNEAQPEVLNILFEEMGIPFRDSEELTDALLDWIDEDENTRLNGAEEDYYDSMDPPYLPGNAPIESWDELRLIKKWDEIFFDPDTGVPNQLFSQLKEVATLYPVSQININAAGPQVLQVLQRMEGIDALGLTDYLHGDDGIPGTEDDNLVKSMESPYVGGGAGGGGSSLVGTEAQLLRIEVTATRGTATFLLTAFVDLGGGGGAFGGAFSGGGGRAGAGGGALRGNNTGQVRDQPRTAGGAAGGLGASVGLGGSGGAGGGSSAGRGFGGTGDAGADLQYPFQISTLLENYKR